MTMFLAVFPANAVSETILQIKQATDTQDYLLGNE
jgi:hypothetical protein